jgi:hypothetical protein
VEPSPTRTVRTAARDPTVLTAPVVLAGGMPDAPVLAALFAGDAGTEGGADRLVVVPPVAVPERPSPTLLAARQLSEEADRDPHRSRGLGPSAEDRRRRRQRALVAERRADRTGTARG